MQNVDDLQTSSKSSHLLWRAPYFEDCVCNTILCTGPLLSSPEETRLEKPSCSARKVQFFFNIVQTGGGQPMFKNYVGNCRVFWRSFNNMKFAWKGTFEALMVKFEGKIGTLYQIFTPCTPLPKYKRAFTWFWGGPIACQDVQMSNHLRMTNSFFRLDTNWLPIRLDTKWLLIGQYWRQWCCPWLNLKLFKGRHRNSNMEFLNIAQIFEHCPNFFEHRSKDLWFKGALPVPCALPLQFRPKKIFLFNLFLFFHYYYHF